MNVINRTAEIIDVKDGDVHVVINRGKARKTAVATAALVATLGERYFLPKSVRVGDLPGRLRRKDGSVAFTDRKTGVQTLFGADQYDKVVTLYAVDARGRVIEDGATIEYLDDNEQEWMLYAEEGGKLVPLAGPFAASEPAVAAATELVISRRQ